MEFLLAVIVASVGCHSAPSSHASTTPKPEVRHEEGEGHEEGEHEDQDEDGDGDLVGQLASAKGSLEAALAASAAQGQPISAKFELDDGHLSLSVYTMKDGKFSEVVLDHDTLAVKEQRVPLGDEWYGTDRSIVALVQTTPTWENPIVKSPSRTARKLFGVFAAILALFAVALLVVLSTLRRIAAADDEVAALDKAKHAGHMAASAVREQYIHQAHTLINFDTSHVGHYGEARTAAEEAVDHLKMMSVTADERQLADRIADLAAENDKTFRQDVLPAVEQGDRSDVKALGDRLEATVDQVVQVNDDLNAMFEHRSAASRARAIDLGKHARTLVLVCFGLAILLAAGVGLGLTRSILRPVGALVDGARRVGAGDLATRIDVPGRDEFATLATTFNQMTVDLARNQEALVRSQKLASIGQVAAGVAHEINNPLGVILGYVKLLQREGDREEVRIIGDEARQCQRIVQGLLDLARPPKLQLGDVDLADIAREAVERLREAGKLAGRDVVAPPADATLPAHGDEARLRQVVTNLIVNAVEATPENGRVTIDAASGGLRVADTGPGIPADVLPRIFDPFFTTKTGGTGLGLAIVHAIVDAHGGKIDVDSRPGAGTTMTLRIPASA
jgi:signal transduction histidine kinase